MALLPTIFKKHEFKITSSLAILYFKRDDQFFCGILKKNDKTFLCIHCVNDLAFFLKVDYDSIKPLLNGDISLMKMLLNKMNKIEFFSHFITYKIACLIVFLYIIILIKPYSAPNNYYNLEQLKNELI